MTYPFGFFAPGGSAGTGALLLSRQRQHATVIVPQTGPLAAAGVGVGPRVVELESRDRNVWVVVNQTGWPLSDRFVDIQAAARVRHALARSSAGAVELWQ